VPTVWPSRAAARWLSRATALTETMTAWWRPRAARVPYPRRRFCEGMTSSRVQAPSSMARLRSGRGGTSSSGSGARPHPMARSRSDDTLAGHHDGECAGRWFHQWHVHRSLGRKHGAGDTFVSGACPVAHLPLLLAGASLVNRWPVFFLGGVAQI
jgi:hypothetical protein